MKTKKISKTKKWITVAIILLIFVVVTISVSLAWFTKEKIYENFDLNFANVKISLTGQNIEALEFEITNTLGVNQTKLMPGDTIKFPIKVTNIGNVPCYYLVNLSSEELNLNINYYFNETTLISTRENKHLGELGAGAYHLLNLENTIDTNFSNQGKYANFNCVAYAIQTKNITKENAYNELIKLKEENIEQNLLKEENNEV